MRAKSVTSERSTVKRVYVELCRQQRLPFPQDYGELAAPSKPGVYVIRKGEVVLHVGRTLRGNKGLHQRLKNHLYGSSSFTKKYLKGNGAVLRKGHNYQFLVVYDPRLRALLEAYTLGLLCPKHIGLGE